MLPYFAKKVKLMLPCMSYLKVVLSKSVAEVAQNVIKYVRLPLLTPEELKQVEVDNEKDRMIPVSFG